MARTKSKKTLEEQEKEKENKEFLLQKRSVALFVGAVLMFAIVLYPGENLWTILHLFFRGTFGILAIVCPLVLGYFAVITAFEMKISKTFIRKAVIIGITVLTLSTLIFLFGNSQSGLHENYFRCIARMFVNARKDFAQGALSGIIGCLLGYPMVFLFGFTISEFLCILVIGISMMALFSISTKEVMVFFTDIWHKIQTSVAKLFRKYMPKNSVRNKMKKLFRREEDIDNNTEYYQDSFVTGNFQENFSAAKQKKERKKTIINIPYEEKTEKLPLQPTIMDYVEGEVQEEKPTAKKLTKKRELANAEKEIGKEVIENFKDKDDTSGYNYPNISLLYSEESKENKEKADEEMAMNESKLDSTLKSFGVNASIVDKHRGPSVTRFEVKPAPGVKISKITNLADDIALNLAANGVRIVAPIPGKSAVGIEIPNKVTTMVTMRELINSQEFRDSKSKLSVVLGKDISGNTIVADLAKMPHLLIAGTTGSGKSVCVNSILISLLYKANPNEVKMVLIDPKMVEFTKYKGIPHLLIDVVIDPKKAAGALNWAVNEMETRYKEFATFGVRDISGYNKMVEKANLERAKKTPEELEENPVLHTSGVPMPDKKMPNIVIAIDEFADLMMTAPNEVEEAICRLAQKARAAGMHLVVATQRPTVNVITGLIKANIPSRIALKVSSQLDSRTILDTNGAEKLIGRGDMLYAPIGISKPLRVQGCFASDEEIERVTDFIKQSHTAHYDEEIEEEINTITEQNLTKGSSNTNSNVSSDDTDSMLNQAIELVLETGQASTSMLQRRLRLGYARAGRLIDEMEKLGVVGPHMGSKSREVLMTYSDWVEKKQRMTEEELQEEEE